MDVRDTAEDVYTMHKQLGLVHYFAAYKNQPIAYQHTSNPGDETMTVTNLRVFMLQTSYGCKPNLTWYIVIRE